MKKDAPAIPHTTEYVDKTGHHWRLRSALRKSEGIVCIYVQDNDPDAVKQQRQKEQVVVKKIPGKEGISQEQMAFKIMNTMLTHVASSKAVPEKAVFSPLKAALLKEL